jgi:hypothetical protein
VYVVKATRKEKKEMKTITVILLSLWGLVPFVNAAPISVIHKELSPLGSGQIIKGMTTGCEGLETTVTLYYGSSDAGTDSEKWESSVRKQMRSGDDGSIEVVLPSVTRGQLYYYRINISNTLGTAWAVESGQFRNSAPGYSESEVNAKADASRDEALRMINASIEAAGGRVAPTRRQQIGNREETSGPKWKVSNIEDWMRVYNGQILDRPWSFCVSDPVAYDNTTASNALRSVSYAKYIRNYEGLKSLTNDEEIKKQYDLDAKFPRELADKLADHLFPGVRGATQLTAILIGSLEFDGSDYVSILVRLSHKDSPREKAIAFGTYSFLKDSVNGVYLQTNDLRDSNIERFLEIAGPHHARQGRGKQHGQYSELYEYYKNSEVPDHFFLFGDE